MWTVGCASGRTRSPLVHHALLVAGLVVRQRARVEKLAPAAPGRGSARCRARRCRSKPATSLCRPRPLAASAPPGSAPSPARPSAARNPSRRRYAAPPARPPAAWPRSVRAARHGTSLNGSRASTGWSRQVVADPGVRRVVADPPARSATGRPSRSGSRGRRGRRHRRPASRADQHHVAVAHLVEHLGRAVHALVGDAAGAPGSSRSPPARTRRSVLVVLVRRVDDQFPAGVSTSRRQPVGPEGLRGAEVVPAGSRAGAAQLDRHSSAPTVGTAAAPARRTAVRTGHRRMRTPRRGRDRQVGECRTVRRRRPAPVSSSRRRRSARAEPAAAGQHLLPAGVEAVASRRGQLQHPQAAYAQPASSGLSSPATPGGEVAAAVQPARSRPHRPQAAVGSPVGSPSAHRPARGPPPSGRTGSGASGCTSGRRGPRPPARRRPAGRAGSDRHQTRAHGRGSALSHSRTSARRSRRVRAEQQGGQRGRRMTAPIRTTGS